MRRRITVIHNPAAGRRSREWLRLVLKELASIGVVATLETTARRGDTEALACGLEAGNCEALAVAGGDGRVNEVANGLGREGPPLALIPTGTVNVMAAEIGLEPTAQAVAAAIATGTARHIHAGRVNGRRFLSMAGIGLDARVVARVGPGLKRRLGRIAYAVQAVHEIASSQPHVYTFVLDGAPYWAAAAVVAKGRYYSERMICAPDARLT